MTAARPEVSVVDAEKYADGDRPDLGPRRVLSWVVDGGLLMAGAILIVSVVLGAVVDRFSSPWWVVSMGAKVVRSGDGYDGVESGFTWSFLGDPVRAVVVALLVLPAFDFFHQLVGLRLTGRTLGKSLAGIQVCPAAARRAGGTGGAGGTVGSSSAIDLRRAVVRAAITTLARAGLPSLGLIALLKSQDLVAAVLGVGWLVALGVCVGTAVNGRRTPADLAAGTIVVRSQQLHRVAARRALAAGQGAARGVTSTIANSESLRRISLPASEQQLRGVRRTAVERGREAAQVANEARKAVAANDRLRQALASDQARAVQDAGASALRRGRDAVRAARQPSQRPTGPYQGSGPAPGQLPAHPRSPVAPPSYPPPSYPPSGYPPPSPPPRDPAPRQSPPQPPPSDGQR